MSSADDPTRLREYLDAHAEELGAITGATEDGDTNRPAAIHQRTVQAATENRQNMLGEMTTVMGVVQRYYHEVGKYHEAGGDVTKETLLHDAVTAQPMHETAKILQYLGTFEDLAHKVTACTAQQLIADFSIFAKADMANRANEPGVTGEGPASAAHSMQVSLASGVSTSNPESKTGEGGGGGGAPDGPMSMDDLSQAQGTMLVNTLAMLNTIQLFRHHKGLAGLPPDIVMRFQKGLSLMDAAYQFVISYRKLQALTMANCKPTLPCVLRGADINKPLGRITMFMLQQLKMHGYCRAGNPAQPYKQIYVASNVATEPPVATHAWVPAVELEDLIRALCSREKHPQMFEILISSTNALKTVANNIRSVEDSLFPTLVRNMHLISCQNGILCIEPGKIGFHAYTDPSIHDLFKSNATMATRCFINAPFNTEMLYARTPYEFLRYMPATRKVFATQRMIQGTLADNSDPVDWVALDEGYEEAQAEEQAAFACEARAEELEIQIEGLDAGMAIHGAEDGETPREFRARLSTELHKTRARYARHREAADAVLHIGSDLPDKRGELGAVLGAIGRTMFKTGQYDNGQFWMLMVGQRRAGKGSLLRLRQDLDDPADVAVMGDNQQQDFQLGHLEKNTRIIIAPDIRQWKLDMGTFLSMLAGEMVMKTKKHETATTIQSFEIQIIGAANATPREFEDPYGAFNERTMFWNLDHQPKTRRMNLTEEMRRHDLANFAYATACCYEDMLVAMERKPDGGITALMSKNQLQFRENMMRATDPWYGFLCDTELVILLQRQAGDAVSADEYDEGDLPASDEEYYTPFDTLFELFKRYYKSKTNRTPDPHMLQTAAYENAFRRVKLVVSPTIDNRLWPTTGAAASDRHMNASRFVDGVVITSKAMRMLDGH